MTTQRYAKDLPPDRLDKLLFDHAFLGLGVGIGALCLLLGWRWGLLAAAVHALSYLALNAAINAVGHSFGKKSYPNTAFNNQWLAFVTGGSSQQPPRRSDIGQARPRPARDGPCLVGDPAHGAGQDGHSEAPRDPFRVAVGTLDEQLITDR